MSDTERLNLIEHYEWKIEYIEGCVWVISGKFGTVWENTIREAVDAALTAQMNWSLGKS